MIEEGIEQSKWLAHYLRKMQDEYKVQKIIASDLIRARQTADIINAELRIPITYTEKLREMNNGKLAGMLNSEAERLYPGVYYNTLEMDERYPGGESPIEFYNRIEKNLKEIIEENKDIDNIMLVTHGGVINVIYHIVRKQKWSNKEKGFKIANVSIHRILMEDDRIKINEIKT